MIDALFYFLMTPIWAVGGTLSARKAIAVAERHYLELAAEAHAKDPRNKPQDKMDGDDWIGASLFAVGAFIAFPAVAVVWVFGKLTKPFRKPTRQFFLPPQQKRFEEHVERMEAQKELVLATAKTYRDVLGWEPEDHPDRIKMVDELQKQITQQLSDLMKLVDPSRPSGFDGDYLESAKEEVKALTTGQRW